MARRVAPVLGAIPVHSWPGDENLQNGPIRSAFLNELREDAPRRRPVPPAPKVTEWTFLLARFRGWRTAARIRRERAGKPAHGGWLRLAR